MVDPEKIRQLVEMMSEHDLAEIMLRSGDEEIILKRPTPGIMPGQFAAAPQYHMLVSSPPGNPAGAAPPGPAPAAPPPAAPAEDEHLVHIKSPMVGTFYAGADPQSPPYVAVGSTVTPETVVCLLEAMKVFNEIKSEVSGSIARILVKNEDPVEFGQTLFLVKPA